MNTQMILAIAIIIALSLLFGKMCHLLGFIVQLITEGQEWRERMVLQNRPVFWAFIEILLVVEWSGSVLTTTLEMLGRNQTWTTSS